MSKVKKIQMPSGTTLDLPDGFDWIGTKAEYDAAWAAGTIKSDWICMITDDTADNPSRANVSLTNLDSVGEARLAEKANVDLSNLSDTGSKMMDGQWVAKTQTLSTATAVGTYTIDLSDYLPNDNYNYEVQLQCTLQLTRDNVGQLGIVVNDSYVGEVSKWSSNVENGTTFRTHISCNFIGRSFLWTITRPTSTGTTNATSCHLVGRAYRRIGLNS